MESIWEISPRAENDPIKLEFVCFNADFFSPSFYCGKGLVTPRDHGFFSSKNHVIKIF